MEDRGFTCSLLALSGFLFIMGLLFMPSLLGKALIFLPVGALIIFTCKMIELDVTLYVAAMEAAKLERRLDKIEAWRKANST